ncbi:hypothetical protein HDK77DRAFT_423277 [Phyllosticta capitalensis]
MCIYSRLRSAPFHSPAYLSQAAGSLARRRRCCTISLSLHCPSPNKALENLLYLTRARACSAAALFFWSASLSRHHQGTHNLSGPARCAPIRCRTTAATAATTTTTTTTTSPSSPPSALSPSLLSLFPLLSPRPPPWPTTGGLPLFSLNFSPFLSILGL